MRSRLGPGFLDVEHRCGDLFDRQQLIDIGAIDVIADISRERRSEDAVAVEDKPLQPPPKPLKVEENERTRRIDHDPAVAEINPVVSDIPGRKVRAYIFDGLHARRYP